VPSTFTVALGNMPFPGSSFVFSYSLNTVDGKITLSIHWQGSVFSKGLFMNTDRWTVSL